MDALPCIAAFHVFVATAKLIFRLRGFIRCQQGNKEAWKGWTGFLHIRKIQLDHILRGIKDGYPHFGNDFLTIWAKSQIMFFVERFIQKTGLLSTKNALSPFLFWRIEIFVLTPWAEKKFFALLKISCSVILHTSTIIFGGSEKVFFPQNFYLFPFRL